MKDIIFIDDFFRIEHWQAKRFIYDVINASVKAVFGFEILYPRQDKSNRIINIDKLYEIAGFQPDNKSFWVGYYYQIPASVENHLSEILPQDAIYISYEAPPWLTNLLNKNNLKYIDIRLSYLRFMSDIPVLISTNIPELSELILNEYKLRDSEIIFEADLLKATLKHNIGGGKKYNFVDNALIILGQTEQDTSLLSKTKINETAKFSDFRAIIKENSEKFSKILYKQHPFSSETHKKFELDVLKQITGKQIQLINNNVYELFSLPFKMKFLGLSSGALVEAKYFGCNSETLLKFPFSQEIKNNYSKFVNISSHYFFSPKFWQECLKSYFEIKEPFNSYHSQYPNIMRNYHNVSWDYGKLISKNSLIFREMFNEQNAQNIEYLELLNSKVNKLEKMTFL